MDYPIRRSLIVFALLLASLAHAKLEWESTHLEFAPSLGVQQVSGAYKFKNVGVHTVKILRTQTSCGCTTTNLTKKEYAPGESGTIEVTMTLPDDGGRRHKQIYVHTDDPDGASTTLEITAEVTRVVELLPHMLVWKQGQTPEAKEVLVTVAAGATVHVLNATSVSGSFTTKLETLEDGRRYRVVVTPQKLAQVETTRIAIATDFPADAPKTYHVYARVIAMPPPVAAPAPQPAQ